MSNSSGDQHHVSIGGSVGGHVVVGRDNTITNSAVTTYPRPTEAELAEFKGAVDAVKKQAIRSGSDEALEAVDQLAEFHAAAVAPKPDLTTMQRVRTWFVDHLPTMAGAVTGLLVHPVVGALVKSAGDAITAEFKERFGADVAGIEGHK
jgi:hypothetical protein